MGTAHYTHLSKSLDEDFTIGGANRKGIVGPPGRGEFSSVAYRPGWSFLQEGLEYTRHLLRTDELASSRLYHGHGKHFLTWDMLTPSINDRDCLRIGGLCGQKMQSCCFEPVVGYYLDNSDGREDMLVQAFSGGVDLSSIPASAPRSIRSRLSIMVAGSMADLHKHHIVYYEPVPTNMRWDMNDTIILNPHPMILFGNSFDTEEDSIQDLAVLTRTHAWIPDKAGFVETYCVRLGARGSDKRRIQDALADREDFIDSNSDYEMPNGLNHYWLGK